MFYAKSHVLKYLVFVVVVMVLPALIFHAGSAENPYSLPFLVCVVL